MDVGNTQRKRQEVYGDYLGGIKLRTKIMDLLLERYTEVHGSDTRMPKLQESAIWDVVNKLTRIAVTPDHVDSWHDLSSYANLFENVLRGEKDA